MERLPRVEIPDAPMRVNGVARRDGDCAMSRCGVDQLNTLSAVIVVTLRPCAMCHHHRAACDYGEPGMLGTIKSHRRARYGSILRSDLRRRALFDIVVTAIAI